MLSACGAVVVAVLIWSFGPLSVSWWDQSGEMAFVSESTDLSSALTSLIPWQWMPGTMPGVQCGYGLAKEGGLGL